MKNNKKKIERDELDDCYTDEELEELHEYLDKMNAEAEERIKKRELDPNAKPIKNPIISEDGKSVIIREITFKNSQKKN